MRCHSGARSIEIGCCRFRPPLMLKSGRPDFRREPGIHTPRPVVMDSGLATKRWRPGMTEPSQWDRSAQNRSAHMIGFTEFRLLVAVFANVESDQAIHGDRIGISGGSRGAGRVADFIGKSQISSFRQNRANVYALRDRDYCVVQIV